MNRYALFLMLLGLETNIILSEQQHKKDVQPDHQDIIAEQILKALPEFNLPNNQTTPLVDTLKIKLETLDYQWPEETIAVINKVSEKINHCVGDVLEEEQWNNMDKFKNVCKAHIVKFMNNLPFIDNETIQRLPDEAIWTCMNALAEAKQIPDKELFLGGLPYLLKGSIENSVFEKMSEKCKKERVRLFKHNIKNSNALRSFREGFDVVTDINVLDNSAKDDALTLRNECSKPIKNVLRAFIYHDSAARDKMAKLLGIECVSTYAGIRYAKMNRGTGGKSGINRKQAEAVAATLKEKTPGGLPGLFNGPINKEALKKTKQIFKEVLGIKKKNREQ